MKTSLKSGTIYLAVSTLIFAFSGYVINIWLGRYLGPASYGIYGVIMSIMTVMNLIQVAGLPQAVAKYVSEDETKSEEVLKAGLILQIISTVITGALVFLFASPTSELFRDRNLIPYIKTISAIFPIYGIYTIYLNYYNGLHQFRTQALMNIIYSVTKLIAVILLVYLLRVYGAIAGFIIAPLITLAIWFHIPKNKTNQFPFRKLLLFSIPLTGYAIFSNLFQSIDLFFIKSLLHADKLTGFYTANQNIAEIPFYGLTALSTVLFPSISRRLSQNLRSEAQNLIAKSLRLSLLILAPGVLIISATSDKLLTLLYSESYHSGANSLSILVIGSGFFTLFSILSTITSSAGSPHKSAILAFIGVLITSVLCIILIPLLGLNGAAYSTTTATGVLFIAASVIVYKKFKVLFPIKSTLKVLVASFTVYMLAKIINTPTVILPLLYLFLFICYTFILLILKEITPDDKHMFYSLLPPFLTKRFFKL